MHTTYLEINDRLINPNMLRPLFSPLRQARTAYRRNSFHLPPSFPGTTPPLTRLSKRHHSTTAPSAAAAASTLLSRFQDATRTETQVLDGNQLRKLSLTLGRPELHPGLDISTHAPRTGTAVPPGYHLVYFTPAGTEAELGADGSDVAFNAPAPFTRRMWAGGRMRWAGEGEGGALRVGDEVEERTRLVRASPKRGRGGGEMVLVEVEKEFWGPGGLALVDER